ncbi:MAG: TaqI-like C-terminal specificity domain-containing protein, partial [Desulfobacterales bacterium]|nr:TaqI-like C-terminal specificity domain-containing protein [Desulfobacterales bacterium]
EKTSPKILIDFGGFQVFDAATVDTSILILRKELSRDAKPALQAVRILNDFTPQADLEGYVQHNAVPVNEFSSESWIISTGAEYAVRKRIEEVGVPLKEWDTAIYRGILTGLNEAFIINGKKKDELIAEDPKSAEIIKPVLRGRDIKHYKVEFADLWIITTFPALQIDINRYPAIMSYLKTFGKRIEQSGDPGCRKKTSNKWFEVQDTIAYHTEFEKEKIVYPDIMRLPRGNNDFSSYPYFYLDKKNFHVEATNFIMTGDGIYLIIAILSSRLGVYAFTKFFAGPQFDEKGFRYKKEYLQNFPIPKVDPADQHPYEILVDCILFAHEKGMTSEASTLEWVVNVMIYGLYFEEVMKKARCYINDRVAEVVKPFKPGDTDAFKTEYVMSLALFFLKDKTVYPGMLHSKNVEPVRIIHGEKK